MQHNVHSYTLFRPPLNLNYWSQVNQAIVNRAGNKNTP